MSWWPTNDVRGRRELSEALTNYGWLVANRLGESSGRPETAPGCESLLYYQRALEAELARVRLQLTRIGLPTALNHRIVNESAVAARA